MCLSSVELQIVLPHAASFNIVLWLYFILWDHLKVAVIARVYSQFGVVLVQIMMQYCWKSSPKGQYRKLDGKIRHLLLKYIFQMDHFQVPSMGIRQSYLAFLIILLLLTVILNIYLLLSAKNLPFLLQLGHFMRQEIEILQID